MRLALVVTGIVGLVALAVSRPALLEAQEDPMATTARVVSSVAIDLKVPSKVETATFALG